jgi:hypothetical protein
VNGIRTVFAQHPQPVLIGIDWYEAWFEPTFAANLTDVLVGVLEATRRVTART